jgi:hypothetical protein
MSNYSNRKKDQFIKSIPKISLDSKNCNILARCKFNFSYFDNSQEAGQDFKDWTQEELCKLLNKLKEYGRKSLDEWENSYIGSGRHKNSIFVNYGDFPRKSDFVFPKHVPHQAKWGRFRLEQAVRLVGFTIPDCYHDQSNNNGNSKFKFDRNTFYIVFLDSNHQFYKVAK